MLAPQSRMRGDGTSLSKSSDSWIKMSSHWGHVDIASTYSNRHGGRRHPPPPPRPPRGAPRRHSLRLLDRTGRPATPPAASAPLVDRSPFELLQHCALRRRPDVM